MDTKVRLGFKDINVWRVIRKLKVLWEGFVPDPKIRMSESDKKAQNTSKKVLFQRKCSIQSMVETNRSRIGTEIGAICSCSDFRQA